MKTESARQDQNSVEYGLALLTFIGVSLLNLFLKRWIGYEAIALVYLLAVVLLALFVGSGPIFLGAALTALGWGYLFAPPLYSFSIGSPYDKMMVAMYFVVALTVAQLTARLRDLASDSRLMMRSPLASHRSTCASSLCSRRSPTSVPPTSV
jgi:K+-sensing histidine kinase KdpD